MFYLDIKRKIGLTIFCVLIIVLVFTTLLAADSSQYGIFFSSNPPLSEDCHDRPTFCYMDLSTKKITALSIDEDMIAPVVSNNGEYIAFANARWSGIYLVSKNADKIMGKTNPATGNIITHAVDNNGNVYFITETIGEKTVSYIYEFNIKSKKINLILKENCRLSGILVNDDGTKIAYMRKVSSKRQLIILDKKSLNRSMLVESSKLYGFDQWRGKEVSFYLDDKNVSMNVRTKQHKAYGQELSDPRIMPDYSKMIYCIFDEETEDCDLFYKDLKTGKEVRLTNTLERNEFDPFWISANINDFRF